MPAMTAMTPTLVLGSLLFVILAAVPEKPLAAENAPVFACDVRALSSSQRQRHERLGRLLVSAATGRRELPNGYELTLDLARLPVDASGAPVCVTEVAEWVDLESRCCPFLEFSIDVKGREKTVRLSLTGAPGVKAFLEEEIPPLKK